MKIEVLGKKNNIITICVPDREGTTYLSITKGEAEQLVADICQAIEEEKE